MKRYLGIISILLATLHLTGCLYQHSRKPNEDLTYETWQRQVDTNPRPWGAGASRWFTDGVSHSVEEMNARAPINAAMSLMNVKVPDSFTNIKVGGRFKVEIFGSRNSNSVYVYGPNAAVRMVKIGITRDTLYVEEAPDAPRNMDCVIVRIGVRDLRSLYQMGPGQVEGQYIRSSGLCVSSVGSGNVYLGGQYNLVSVNSRGCGNINLFGAVTPVVDITTSGAGSVNVSGNVGVHSITHHGTGNINIIGANSDCLVVHADGKGKIGINGRVAVREIDARDRTCVYIYYVNGGAMNVYVTDNARVGVAGCVTSLNVDAGKAGRFEGHYLYANDAYVRAHDVAHINVTGTNKVFAASTGNSSVYLFSSPNVLTQFYRDYGVVLPILSDRAKLGCGYCPYYKDGVARVYKD